MKNHVILGSVGALFLASALYAVTGGRQVSIQGTFLQSGSGATLRTIESKLRDVKSIQDYGAVCDGSTDDRAAIQAAIDAVPAGGTLWIPNSIGTAPFWNCRVCSGLPLLITKSIIVRGNGGLPANGATGPAIEACSSLGASTDVILVQAGSATLSVKFADISIIPQSGTPGRYGIHFDAGTGTFNQSNIEKIYIGPFGSAAIRAENGGSNGSISASNIFISNIVGGLSLVNTGDSVTIRENTILGTGSALDASFIAGAALMQVVRNYILSDGGLHFGASTTAVEIIGNEIQTQGTFTGSNGAVLDIDGTSGNHAVDTIIARNSFQVVNGITANEIRLNFSDRSNIYGNRFGRGITTSKDIVVTANATETYIGTNTWPSGGPYTSMVADSGTRTVFAAPYPGSGVWAVANNQGIGALDDAGNVRTMIKTNADGSIAVNGYHGTSLLAGINGANYFYDAAGNVAAVASGGASNVPATFLSVFKLYLAPVTFATLPAAPTNGQISYCSDCTIANPCAAAGTGAMAKRLNGVWVCN